MYQALYRKYRPKTFDEVIGQDVIVKTLKNAVINNKISHAYLFTGVRGTGKTTVAKILAKTINCDNPENATPCDHCVSCLQTNKKQNTDIIEIDAASNNGVDEIRELRSKVSLVPSISKYKVYIIDEVHMLTQGAFNALLKTLEEPPKHIVFVLATTEPQKIPLTILSRCQRFDFKKISEKEIIKQINYILEQENIILDEKVIKEIARLSYGGMRDAISLLDQALAYSQDLTLEDVYKINGTLAPKEIKDFVMNIIDNNIAEILMKIEKYDEDGINFIKVIDEIIDYLKNIVFKKLISNNGASAENDIDDEIVNKIGTDKLITYIEKLNNAVSDMHNVNNKRLIFELAVIKLLNNDNGVIKEKKETSEPIVVEKKVLSPEKNKEKGKKLPDEFMEVKNIRINNTLAKFSRQKMLEIRKNIVLLRSAIINPEYNEAVSLALDAKINAASDEYIIFVLPSNRMADSLNYRIPSLEKAIQEYLKINYKVIATYDEEWENIKETFNSKTKKYQYQKEEFNIEEMLKEKNPSEKDSIENLFSDVITYV